jgi:hypothetical protein
LAMLSLQEEGHFVTFTDALRLATLVF